MKILVLGGSPNKKGSTQILVDNFLRGAEEAGHTVTVLNVAAMNVRPCSGCIACGYDGPCVQKDDMTQIRKAVMESDMLVFATPLFLLRLLGAAQNGHRPLLRFQQPNQHAEYEVCFSLSGLERR